MRLMTTLVCLLGPLVAQAQPVSETTLEESFEQCVMRCTPDGARGACAELCRCITDQMAEAWDEADFRERADALEADPGDSQVVAEIDAFADRCAGG